jgi:hypothetical protein
MFATRGATVGAVGRGRARMKFWRAAVVVVLSAALVGVFAVAPANANELGASAVGGTAVELSPEEVANVDALLAASRNDGELSFSPVEASLLGASDESIIEYGGVLVALGAQLEGSASNLTAAIIDRAQQVEAVSCVGRIGYTGTYWFGRQFAANSCNTGALINGLTIAAGGGGVYAAVSALTAVGLPAAAVVGTISAILVVGIGFLQVCRDTSSINAIYLNTGIPGVVVPSCWAQ